MEKRAVNIAAIIFLIFLLVPAFVSAVTATLQGARMVLSAQVGEKIERSITVMNRNDISVTINITKSGDLADNLVISGKTTFELEPGQEQKVFFTIKASEPGTTETRINVLFIPSEGNAVGLPAVITFVASGEGQATTDDGDAQKADNSDGISLPFSGQSANSGNSTSSFKLSYLSMLLIGTSILFIIFIVLVIYSKRLNRKKGMRRFRVK